MRASLWRKVAQSKCFNHVKNCFIKRGFGVVHIILRGTYRKERRKEGRQLTNVFGVNAPPSPSPCMTHFDSPSFWNILQNLAYTLHIHCIYNITPVTLRAAKVMSVLSSAVHVGSKVSVSYYMIIWYYMHSYAVCIFNIIQSYAVWLYDSDKQGWDLRLFDDLVIAIDSLHSNLVTTAHGHSITGAGCALLICAFSSMQVADCNLSVSQGPELYFPHLWIESR